MITGLHIWGDLYVGKGCMNECDFVYGERLELMLVLWMSISRMVRMVLVLRGVGPILGNGYGT